MKLLPIASLLVGAWMIMNGLLHDIFILISDHGKKYDRDLLRLLMDGHILITCGAIQMIAYIGLKENQTWSFMICGLACLSLLVYLGMIFPFLKSFGAISLNLTLLILLLVEFFRKA